MNVVLFSWEYPPRIVGQLADYVKTLVTQLAKNHIQPYVVTYHDYLTGDLAKTRTYGLKGEKLRNSLIKLLKRRLDSLRNQKGVSE